jgi:hypothetical protein
MDAGWSDRFKILQRRFVEVPSEDWLGRLANSVQAVSPARDAPPRPAPISAGGERPPGTRRWVGINVLRLIPRTRESVNLATRHTI